MKKVIVILIFILLTGFKFTISANASTISSSAAMPQVVPLETSSTPSAASAPNITYLRALVINITNATNGTQNMTVQLIDGQSKGKQLQVNYDPQHVADLRMQVGQTIILNKETDSSGHIQYYVNDKYRLPQIIIAVVAFFILIMLIAGWKGLGSILGLIISLAVIFGYIIPQIIAGADALTVSMIGSVIILFLTTYVAHGISRQTTIALFSTLVSLLITYLIAIWVVQFTLLNGYGNSDATDLHFGTTSIISLKGILLGGIIISTLGALNDVTVTQAHTVFELANQNRTLSFKQLFARSFMIGREHAISIINTLVLAFAGSGLAILIFFLFNPQQWPYWVIINSESFSEEIIKAIGGTAGLLLAVPIVTLLAAAFCNHKFKQMFGKILQ